MADSSRLSKDRVRVSITPKKEMVEQIDAMASRLGMSRSAVCSMLIATGLESYQMILQLPEEKLKVLVESLK